MGKEQTVLNVRFWQPIPNLRSTGYMGYLCYYYMATNSDLPIRRKDKDEPHYEDKTYGEKRCCEWQARAGCVKHGSKYIFFRTKLRTKLRTKDYHGRLPWEPGYSYIVGYYFLSDFKLVNCPKDPPHPGNCYAIRASQVKFVEPDEAIKLDEELYVKLFSKPYPKSFRAPRALSERAVKHLIELFNCRKNVIARYVQSEKRDNACRSKCF